MICESRLQQIAHTVKFTKLANMIILKRSLIVQSQKLVTAYTRPQVGIVSSYFTGNNNITLLFIIQRIVLLSSIQPKAETLDFSTHACALSRNLLKIFPPHEHKGSIVKQSGNGLFHFLSVQGDGRKKFK